MNKNINQEEVLVLNLPVILASRVSVMVFALIFSLSFFVPFFLGHPQWLVGTIVNCCLFLAAIFLPKKFFLPLIIFPSLGVLARGAIFGPFTLFLIYFLPFIWLGNLVLILVFRGLTSLKTFKDFGEVRPLVAVFFASFAKYLFLISAANVYFKFHIVPKIFLQAMGINQLLTALAGGVVVFIIFNFYGQHIARSQRAS